MLRASPLAPWRLPVFFVALAAALAVPSMGLDAVWQGIALVVLINACGALGMVLLFGYAGQLSIAQAAFMGVGAYGTAILTITHGYPHWVGLAGGVLAAMVIAAVIGYPVLRLHGLYLAMATLAINLILIVVIVEQEHVTGGSLGFVGLEPLTLFGKVLDEPGELYYPALAAFLILFLMAYRLIRSPIGAMLSALRHDERAASLCGISVAFLKTKTFVVSAAFAGVAGFFLAQYLLFVPPESFGLFPSIYFLIMVVVGGMRSLSGAVVGAAFITIVPQLAPGNPRLQQFVFAIAFLLITMFAPDGIVGMITSAWKRLLGIFGRGRGRGGPHYADEAAAKDATSREVEHVTSS